MSPTRAPVVLARSAEDVQTIQLDPMSAEQEKAQRQNDWLAFRETPPRSLVATPTCTRMHVTTLAQGVVEAMSEAVGPPTLTLSQSNELGNHRGWPRAETTTTGAW